jgi:hypothetical protein
VAREQQRANEYDGREGNPPGSPRKRKAGRKSLTSEALQAEEEEEERLETGDGRTAGANPGTQDPPGEETTERAADPPTSPKKRRTGRNPFISEENQEREEAEERQGAEGGERKEANKVRPMYWSEMNSDDGSEELARGLEERYLVTDAAKDRS